MLNCSSDSCEHLLNNDYMPGIVTPVVADYNGSGMGNAKVDRKRSSMKTGWDPLVCVF